MANNIAIDMHDHVIGFSPNIQEDTLNVRLHNLAYKYLLDGYGVIYAAESPTTNSSFLTREGHDATTRKQQDGNRQQHQEILNNISTDLRTDKVKRYFQKGLLAIEEPETILPTNSGVKQLLDSLSCYVERYESKVSRTANIKGKVLINSPDSFFEAQEFDKFLEFEHRLGRKFEDDFLMACWYRKKWAQNLSFSQIIHLLTAHNRTVHKNAQFQMLNTDRILQIISEGIDKAVEQDNASVIILEVIQRRFNLTTSKIVASPDLFVETLKNMSPDRDSAETIINTLETEFKTRLDFGNSFARTHGSSRRPRGNQDAGLQLQKKSRKKRSNISTKASNTRINRTKEEERGSSGKDDNSSHISSENREWKE